MTTAPGRRLAVEDAMAVLGVASGASWDEVRRAFRARIREVHPDLVGDDPILRNRAVLLTQAYDTLERATAGGARPLRQPNSSRATTAPPGPAVVLHAPPGAIFPQLLSAARSVGEVSLIEPDTGRIEVLVRHGVGPLCRLGLTVEGDNVAFSLDALDQGEPPPIHAVVRRLADALERGARRPNR